MQIDIHADTVCPWCLIGIGRLRQAIAARPGAGAKFRWRSFLLNPDMPHDGMSWDDYLTIRFGTVARGQAVHERIAEVGKEVGAVFRFDRIQRIPNSLDSHRLLLHAVAQDLEAEFFAVLTGGFFVEGADIGDKETLIGLARSAGLNGDDARAVLNGDAYRDEVLAQDRRTRRVGFDSVPTFVFADRFAVAGAQTEETLTPMLDLARSQSEQALGLKP